MSSPNQSDNAAELISNLQRELAFYFGASHGNGTHRRPAADCDESECVRIRKLLNTRAPSAEYQKGVEDAARVADKYLVPNYNTTLLVTLRAQHATAESIARELRALLPASTAPEREFCAAPEFYPPTAQPASVPGEGELIKMLRLRKELDPDAPDAIVFPTAQGDAGEEK